MSNQVIEQVVKAPVANKISENVSEYPVGFVLSSSAERAFVLGSTGVAQAQISTGLPCIGVGAVTWLLDFNGAMRCEYVNMHVNFRLFVSKG